MWVTPDSQSPPVVPTAEGEMAFLPVICVSASKLVEEGGVERRLGYTYVQGSGDDHEQWSQVCVLLQLLLRRDTIYSPLARDWTHKHYGRMRPCF